MNRYDLPPKQKIAAVWPVAFLSKDDLIVQENRSWKHRVILKGF